MAVTLLASATRPARAQAPALLRLHPAPGQVSRYRSALRMFINAPGLVASDTVPAILQCTDVTETVDSVQGDTLVLRVTTDSSRARVPELAEGQVGRDVMRGMTSRVLMDARGHRLDFRVSSGALPLPGGGAITGLIGGLRAGLPGLPDSAVKVGDSWDDSVPVEIPIVGTRASGLMHVTSHLERLEQHDSDDVAVIGSSGGLFVGTRGQLAMTVRGTSSGQVAWDLSHGRVRWTAATTTGTMNLMSMGVTAPFTLDIAMTLTGASNPLVDSTCASVGAP